MHTLGSYLLVTLRRGKWFMSLRNTWCAGTPTHIPLHDTILPRRPTVDGTGRDKYKRSR